MRRKFAARDELLQREIIPPLVSRRPRGRSIVSTPGIFLRVVSLGFRDTPYTDGDHPVYSGAIVYMDAYVHTWLRVYTYEQEENLSLSLPLSPPPLLSFALASFSIANSLTRTGERKRGETKQRQRERKGDRERVRQPPPETGYPVDQPVCFGLKLLYTLAGVRSRVRCS